MLLKNNIKPILVFDGRQLPAKEKTEIKRREYVKKNMLLYGIVSMTMSLKLFKLKLIYIRLPLALYKLSKDFYLLMLLHGLLGLER